MEYTIKSLANLAGISTRTLRYYDEIGLLKPIRVNSSGYRIYGELQVDILQQIMFYKEMELPLEEIREIIHNKNFNFESALIFHRERLLEKQAKIEKLLINVDKTLKSIKGDVNMTDKEKFEGFKEKMIKENEEKYGKEIREKYGEDTISKSNAKFKNMTKEQWDEINKVNEEFFKIAKIAFEKGDINSDEAKKMVETHKKWLSYFSDYCDDAHIGVTQMYVDDERFAAYYEPIGKGSNVFLRDATKAYYGK